MNIAKIRTMDISNGPGIRASIFVSGCNNNCKGCFNKEAQDFNYGEKYSEELEKRIFKILENEHIQGLSILGGEPLDPKNQEEVLALIVKVKEKYPKKDIWLWSGYTIENLISRENPITNKILEKIDYIVDGPFIEELKNPSLEFRGSSNQRIINTEEYFKQRNEAIVYKIEDCQEDYPKQEFVKVLSKHKETVTVQSIVDDYIFDYDRNFFEKKKQIATKEEIENAKFELVKSKESNKEEEEDEL